MTIQNIDCLPFDLFMPQYILKARKRLNNGTGCPGRVSNQATHEYEPEALQLEAASSFRMKITERRGKKIFKGGRIEMEEAGGE
jgi:hypothetical protein